MDVRFIYVHLFQCIEEDDIGGRVVVNEYSLDPSHDVLCHDESDWKHGP